MPMLTAIEQLAALAWRERGERLTDVEVSYVDYEAMNAEANERTGGKPDARVAIIHVPFSRIEVTANGLLEPGTVFSTYRRLSDGIETERTETERLFIAPTATDAGDGLEPAPAKPLPHAAFPLPYSRLNPLSVFYGAAGRYLAFWHSTEPGDYELRDSHDNVWKGATPGAFFEQLALTDAEKYWLVACWLAQNPDAVPSHTVFLYQESRPGFEQPQRFFIAMATKPGIEQAPS